jgi:retron-type reverse transcriptase
MKMTDYEKVYDFQSLYNAYQLAARGKHGRPDVIQFEMNLPENLWRLHDELESGTYRPAPYNHFTIHDPKTREIQALSFADRVVQRSLCDNALRPGSMPG